MEGFVLPMPVMSIWLPPLIKVWSGGGETGCVYHPCSLQDWDSDVFVGIGALLLGSLLFFVLYLEGRFLKVIYS